jgi:hypothetical protein
MTEEQQKPAPFPYKFVLMGGALAALIGLSLVVLLQPGGSGCEDIFEQAAPTLSANIEIIESKGAFAVGHEQIQELTEGAQKVGLHLKTCCTVLQGGKLDPGQFQQCMDKAASYERKIIQVVQQVSEAAEAKANGAADVVAVKVANINQTIQTASADVETLGRQVAQIKPVVARPEPVRPVIGSGQETEPNNVAAQATELPLNGEMAGEITSNEDSDYFKLLPSKDLRDRVVVKLQNYSESLRPYFTLYNDKKSKIETVYDNVSPWDTTGKYKVITRYQNAHDAFEPNDTAAEATPIVPGKMVQANVMDASDADWYKLVSAPAESVRVVLKNRSTSLRPYVYVYDHNRSKLLEKYDNTVGASLDFSFDAVPGETCFIQVTPWDTNGAYELTVK